MALFDESSIVQAAHEVDSIQLDQYEFFTESICESVECKIYRKYDQESGLYEYKVIAFLYDVTPEICKRVYMDLEYRTKWDSYVKDLYEFEDSDIKGIYWNANYPFPMSNRDYTYIRELRELDVDGVNVVVVLAHSHPLSSIPKKSGVIRVTDYHQSLAIKSDGKVGTKGVTQATTHSGHLCVAAQVWKLASKLHLHIIDKMSAFMHYFDNPGGMIPSWLINWAAKTGVPSFMTSMRDACVNYSKYLQESGQN